MTTLELAEARECGAVFQYPDALRPLEWACLRALQRARGKQETKSLQRQKREAEQRRVAGLVQHRP
jgi:hypothetical protein